MHMYLYGVSQNFVVCNEKVAEWTTRYEYNQRKIIQTAMGLRALSYFTAVPIITRSQNSQLMEGYLG